MTSAAAVHSLTPSDLETRLAALGIPVARLIATAHIPRSTWRDWRTGRTRPRPDRWAAATAAFDALIAEATPAAAEVVTLTGSSAPTGAPPSFTPIATAAPAGERGPAAVDPIPPLREEWRARYHAYCTLDPSTQEAEDAAYDLVTAVERRAVASRATTLAGAIVSIEWARAEFADNMEDGVIGEKLVLALLDGALRVLCDHTAIIPALPPPADASLEHAA